MSALSRMAVMVVALGVSSCGAGTEPASSVDSTSSDPAPAAEAVPEAPAEPAAAESKPAPEAESDAEQAPAEQKAREVTYTQSPEGLKIEVAGVRFVATADPVRAGGGWGVKVKVVATAQDSKPHQLLSPKNGPLAFAGKVDRGGKVEQLSDERSGDEEKAVAEKGFEFSRVWPGKSGAQPLKAGEKLELQVGLWGLGESSDALRPVRQFLTVKMAAGKKTPQPVVSPPASASTDE
jgi:hypothetical protein